MIFSLGQPGALRMRWGLGWGGSLGDRCDYLIPETLVFMKKEESEDLIKKRILKSK